MKNKLLLLYRNIVMYSFYSLTIQLFLCTMVLATEVSNAQKNVSVKEAYASLDFNSINLVSVFKKIEQNTDYTFTYDRRELDKKIKLSGNYKNTSLYEILMDLSRKADLGFKQLNNNIIVSKLNEFEEEDIVEIFGDLDISGKITDENGQGLPGVSIVIKETTIGTTTNLEGNYKLSVPEGSTIAISFVGYVTQELLVGNQSVIDLQMKLDARQLEEIVVVGYGTQQKVNLTGAVGTASGDVMNNRPIANVGEGLQGVIPNLNVDIRNGDPSGPIDFNIRGYESINGGNPLVLVDGVPMDLNKLNPNDIASISVLKDASAAAVYGARAAFGVVLVETKKGKTGKMNVSFGAEYAAAKPILFLDPITDPYQFALARNLATQRTSGSDSYDADYLAGTKAWSENPTDENAWGVFNGQLRFYGYNNYQDRLITETSPQQKYNMSVSGATDRTSYYVSFGYLNKDGYLKNKEKNENFKRYNLLVKGESKINNWLKLDTRALVTVEKSDKPHFYHWDVNINTTARVNPLMPIQFPDLPFYLTPGDRADFEPLIGKYFGSVNFLPYLEDGGRETWTNKNVVLTQGITLNPIKGLNIRGEFSANFRDRNYEDVQSKLTVIDNQDLAGGIVVNNGFSGDDWIFNQANNDEYYVFNTYADYTLDKFTDHYLKAMVGFNQEWGRFQFINAKGSVLLSPNVPDLNATTGNQAIGGGKEHTALRGVFYRVNYIYKDKYLVEANGRYDGTSRFPTDDRFGFFPSLSVGWKLSNESFMNGTSDVINNLKLRASIGTLGNQLLFEADGTTPIYYPAIPSMGTGSSQFMLNGGSFTPFVSPAGLVSPTLTWESVVSKNIGLDFTMLNNRLDVSFDVFSRETKDMLMGQQFPMILGTDAPDANAADLKTSGWEIAATWRNRVNKDWNYGITLALSDTKSKITKFVNPTGSLEDLGVDNYYIGQTIGEIWGFETEGIFQSESEIAAAPDQSQIGTLWRPGDMRYADLNGDGVISKGNNTLEDHGDLKIIGQQSPRYTFGISGNAGYKNFTLNLFFQGVLKYDYLPPNDNWVAFYPFNAGHVENYYLTDTWSEDNPDAYFAAPHITTGTKQNIEPQSRYVQNGSYMRLKNLTLAYNLPIDIASKVGLGDAQVYVSGQNLFEFTSMRKPLDPEVRPTLTQEYYKQRIYSLGLRITF